MIYLMNLIRKEPIQLFLSTFITLFIISIPLILSLLSSLPHAPPTLSHSPTDEYFNILHISDLHLSSINNKGQNENFEQFCEMISEIQPDAVIVTGDLANSRNDNQVPMKLAEDYDVYNSTVNKCLRNYKTVWYDMLGNHDIDGLYTHNDPRNIGKTFLRGNTGNEHVGYIDLKKEKSIMRVVSADVYGDIYLSYEGEGYLENKHIDKMVELIDSFNSNDNNKNDKNDITKYTVIAAHKNGRRVYNEHHKSLSSELQKRSKDISKVTAYIFGHIHNNQMSSYGDGFLSTKVRALKNKVYKQMIFKNSQVYFEEYNVNEIPVVPICPGDSTNNCKYTEVFVGGKMKKVSIILPNKQIIQLNSVDNKIWKSETIIKERSFDVEIIPINNQKRIVHFDLGSKYKTFNDIQLEIDMWVIIVVSIVPIAFMILLRIICGYIQQKTHKFSKVALFVLYSKLTNKESIIFFILIIAFLFIPNSIGYQSFVHEGKQLLFFAGPFGAHVGDYSSFYTSPGFGFYGLYVVVLWLCAWTICHWRSKHYFHICYGLFMLVALFILYTFLINHIVSPSAYFMSPITYLIVGFIIYPIVIIVLDLLKKNKTPNGIEDELLIEENDIENELQTNEIDSSLTQHEIIVMGDED